MTVHTTLPILFPKREKELFIKISVIAGDINMVDTTVDNYPLRFMRNSNGFFMIEKPCIIDSLFVNHIEWQLNRTFE